MCQWRQTDSTGQQECQYYSVCKDIYATNISRCPFPGIWCLRCHFPVHGFVKVLESPNMSAWLSTNFSTAASPLRVGGDGVSSKLIRFGMIRNDSDRISVRGNQSLGHGGREQTIGDEIWTRKSTQEVTRTQRKIAARAASAGFWMYVKRLATTSILCLLVSLFLTSSLVLPTSTHLQATDWRVPQNLVAW